MRIPGNVAIETLNHCNARCVMCPATFTSIAHGTMSDAMFSHIVDELETWRQKPTVSLHGTGEPTLFKRLPERIAALARRGIAVNLTTNGSLMNEARCRAILLSGVSRIEFSIESTDRNTFASIRPGLDIDKILDNFATCCRLRTELRPSVKMAWMFVSHEDNAADYDKCKAFFQEHAAPGDFMRANPRHNYGGKVQSSIAPSNDECMMMGGINILYDGSVNVCCVDTERDIVFGNIMEQSILELYNNPEYVAFRDKHANGKRHEIRLCASCNTPDAVRQCVTYEMAA